jgi:AGZA family xanthine/uracil permease-like MFS transporter
MTRRLLQYILTNWRTEILAGLTTFITMAYIIFVNPAILSQTGMPLAAVTTATCLCAAFGSILMGALANYPLALAPGMGLNAYFTYTVVLKGMGVPWQTALGAVFSPASSSSPSPSPASASARRRHPAPTPRRSRRRHRPLHRLHRPAQRRHHRAQRRDHRHARQPALPEVALAIFGILLIAVLQVLRVKASMLIGVLTTMALGIIFHQVHGSPQPYHFSAIKATAFHLDIRGALHIMARFEIIFVFLFVDLFDNIGTLVAVTQRAGLIAETTPSPASTASSSPTPPPPSLARSWAPAPSPATSNLPPE